MGGGGGEITLSSLEDVCSSEVSDIRDLFAFFDLLFIGPDESDSELEPFLLFLFEVLHILRAFCSGLTSAFACVVGVPFSGTAGTGFLGAGSGFLGAGFCDDFCLSELFLGPVVLLTVVIIAS